MRRGNAPGRGAARSRLGFTLSLTPPLGLFPRRETLGQLAQSRVLSAAEQLSCTYLAANASCDFDASTAGALARAAAFVVDQKAVPSLLPRGRHLPRDATGAAAPLLAARAFFRRAVRPDLLRSGIAPPTPTLAGLRAASSESLPVRRSQRTHAMPDPAACGSAQPSLHVLSAAGLRLSDGAGGAGGASYQPNLLCEWVVLSPAEAMRRAVRATAGADTADRPDWRDATGGASPGGANGSATLAAAKGEAAPLLVELRFERFLIWNGDRCLPRPSPAPPCQINGPF